jgi:hypothetical protein
MVKMDAMVEIVIDKLLSFQELSQFDKNLKLNISIEDAYGKQICIPSKIVINDMYDMVVDKNLQK